MKKLIKCEHGVLKEMTLDETINEFKKMVHSKEVTRWNNRYEKDDLIQMAYMGLMKAYEYYDISQNMSFIVFSKKVINDLIANTYKKENRQKRGGNVETCSIYSFVDDTEDVRLVDTIKDEKCNCEESALTNITNKKILEVLNTFSLEDKEMIDLHFMKGLNGAEIGRMYNKTRACISYRLKQITKKLQNQLLNEVMV